MRLRYEIRDTKMEGRGQRFTNIDHAIRELEQAVGEPGRFELFDRRDKRVLCAAP